MGTSIYDPWERVRGRALDDGDDDLRALLRDADEMRRFIEHLRRASTWYGWPLHGDAVEVLAGLGRPVTPDPECIAAARREPVLIDEERLG